MRTLMFTMMTGLAAISVGGWTLGEVSATAPVLSDEVPHFVEMEPVSAPIIGSGRMDGVLQIGLVLEAGTAADAERLRDRMPALRDASFLSALEFSRLHASGYMPVDAVELGQRLTEAVKEAEPAVRQVLIVQLSAFPPGV